MFGFLHAKSEVAKPPPENVLPRKTSVEAISLADIQGPELLIAVAAWRKWRGVHALPQREWVELRDLGGAAAHISLARVIDAGGDYEFRIIGDAHIQAYGSSYQGKMMSDVIAAAPRFGKQLKASYDLVRSTHRPYAFRGMVGRDVPDSRFVWFETCYLPFGADEVDYIMNAAIYSPPGKELE